MISEEQAKKMREPVMTPEERAKWLAEIRAMDRESLRILSKTFMGTDGKDEDE